MLAPLLVVLAMDASGAIATARAHAPELAFEDARVRWDAAAGVWQVDATNGLAWVSTGGGVVYRLGKPAAARWAPDLSFKFGPDGRYQTSRELGLPRVTQLDGGAPIVGTAIALALQYAMLEVAPMSVEKLGNRIIVVVAGRVFWGCGRLAVFIDADTGRVVDEQPTSYIDGGYATDCAAFWEWRTPFIADPPPPTTIDL